MTSNKAKNEIEVAVLIDLAAICKKLAENSAVPEELRLRAREFVEEFDSLVTFRGKGAAPQHFGGEALLLKMARFLPRITELESWPADASNL